MSGEPIADPPLPVYPFDGVLRVPAAVLGRMIERARAALPNEACGLAGGHGDEVVEVYPLTNAAASPERYTVDPVEQLDAYLAMADADLEAVAIYHSHPATPARPSATDISEAYDSASAYVIVSLAFPEPSVRAFRIVDGTVSELTIVTTDEAAA